MKRPRLPIVPVVVLGLMLAPRAVLAQSPDAEAHVEHGLQLREKGHDDEALAEFQQAYAIAPTPRVKAQIGFAHQALGQWVLAEADLDEALSAASDPWILSHRAVIDGALSTIGKHVGSLEIRGGVAGAEVLLDGARVGTLPMAKPLRVELGTRTLEVHAPGYYPLSRTLIVGAGGTTRESLDMTSLPAQPESAATSPLPHAPLPVTPEPHPATSSQSTFGWIGLGAAAVFLAGGIVGIAERESVVSAYNGDAACPGTGSSAQPQSCSSRVSSASTWEAVAITGFVGAGVLAAGGALLLVTAPKTATVASLQCRGGWATVRCAMSF